MSVTTYPTIPALPVRTTNMTTNFSRILKGEWTKVRTLPSTWRTAVFALVFSIGTGAVLVISQANQWHTMTPAQRQTFDRDELLAVWHHDRRRTARVARPTVGDRRICLWHDPLDLHRHADEATRACGQGSHSGGIRLPRGAGLQFRRLRNRPADLRRQAPPSDSRPSRRADGDRLWRCRSQPHRRHRSRSRRRHSTHRRGNRCDGVVIVGGVTFGQLLPAGLRGYLPGTALQAAVTVHRSPGILAPGTAIVVLGVYAAIALAAASIRGSTPRRLTR